MTDWFEKYMGALAMISDLRGSLSFIEGYSNTIAKYPQTNAEWVGHMNEINARALKTLNDAADKDEKEAEE